MGVLLGHRMRPAPVDATAPHERWFNVLGQRIDAVSPSNPDVVAEKHPHSNIALSGRAGVLIEDFVRQKWSAAGSPAASREPADGIAAAGAIPVVDVDFISKRIRVGRVGIFSCFAPGSGVSAIESALTEWYAPGIPRDGAAERPELGPSR